MDDNTSHLACVPHVCEFYPPSALPSFAKDFFYHFILVLKRVSCYNTLLAFHRDDFREEMVSMAPARHVPSLERRQLRDRRARPTALWRALRWQGRRSGFRRAGEGYHAYVDGLTHRTVLLALLVYVGSLLDALFTLHHLQQGGRRRIRCWPWHSLVASPSFSP